MTPKPDRPSRAPLFDALRTFRRLPLLAAILLLTACSQTPQAYFVHQPVPVGAYNLTVTGSDLHQYGDRAILKVRFRIEAANGQPDLERFFRKVRFSVHDSEDKAYDSHPFPEIRPGTNPLQAMEAARKHAGDMEEMLKSIGADTERWELLVLLPASAHNLKLYIRNRSANSGQPNLAAVDLAR